jgi:hypothetical protein
MLRDRSVAVHCMNQSAGLRLRSSHSFLFSLFLPFFTDWARHNLIPFKRYLKT